MNSVVYTGRRELRIPPAMSAAPNGKLRHFHTKVPTDDSIGETGTPKVKNYTMAKRQAVLSHGEDAPKISHSKIMLGMPDIASTMVKQMIFCCHIYKPSTVNNGGQTSERECESPPEPAPPEVPPRGPSLHVTLRHRPVPCEQPSEPDRLYLSEGT
ncbi:unnamed protein product [Diatraea saccharalis]|uniref:Uncharacterized protein n=1 Tax=Diatraea saccharalis TaxID=40085 RepID=A0A9N9WIC9_9NEOP|nr:unnamed protein product [Diatraea saccharalis]